MPSQILITGATGFIGRRLTRDLVSAGHFVRVLARSRSKAEALFNDRVEIVGGDLYDAASLARACRGIETIYHIAGSYRFGLRHRQELWRTNVEGTESLLGGAAAARVGTVVHLSSGGVLNRAGAVTFNSPLEETDFPTEAPRWCPYKFSKWHAEQRALGWAEKGLSVVIASTTCPIGRGDESPTPTGQMIRDFLRHRFPFYCHTGLNFIGMEDLSRGLQQAAAYGQSGERYLLSHENLWLKSFLQLLARETDLTAPQTCLPSSLIHLIGMAGEAADLFNPSSTSARVCVETALQADRIQFFSNGKAREELHWTPSVPLIASVREAVAWFRRVAEPGMGRGRGAAGRVACSMK